MQSQRACRLNSKSFTVWQFGLGQTQALQSSCFPVVERDGLPACTRFPAQPCPKDVLRRITSQPEGAYGETQPSFDVFRGDIKELLKCHQTFVDFETLEHGTVSFGHFGEGGDLRGVGLAQPRFSFFETARCWTLCKLQVRDVGFVDHGSVAERLGPHRPLPLGNLGGRVVEIRLTIVGAVFMPVRRQRHLSAVRAVWPTNTS